MNLVMRLGVFVFISFSISVQWFTVSKACDMSRAIVMVLWGGFFWLNPVVTWLVSW